MSFFEQMMKLNQYVQSNRQSVRQSLYQEQQTAPNQQCNPLGEHNGPKKMLRDFSIKSSVSLKDQELQDEEEWSDVFQEPCIQPVYVQPKAQLLHHLLPRKQQMMRQMLAKKKQFQLRKMNLCSEKKGILLESKVQEVSQKIKNSQIFSLNGNKKSSEKSEKMRMSSVRGLSDNKPKKIAVNLGESVFSASLHTQMVASPTADTFNKQIMLKLLSIIQKDRQNVPPQQTNRQRQNSAKKSQKEGPIIINNIMKTPMDNMNRDLIERQMKIKMLENDRSIKQYSRGSDSKPKSKHSIAGSQLVKDKMVMTDRSNGRPSMGGLSVTTGSNHRQSDFKKVDKSASKTQVCFRKQEQIYKQLSFDQTPREINEQNRSKGNCEESTNNNSNQNSRVVQGMQSKKSRPRDFKKNRANTKKQQNAFEKIQSESSKNEVTKIEPIKPPVRIDIPFEGQKQTEGMTLAEAFKKRIGRLKSEQKKQERLQSKSPMVKGTSNFPSFPSQMAITISDKYTEYNGSQFDYSAPVTGKNIKINIDSSLTNRSFPSRLKQKQNSLKKLPKDDKSVSKKMSEPSKELMDRLIYGEKAKISKGEMYALTKKNYNNLPQVKAKREEQERRRAELERKSKAKQYQKAIRSGKSQHRS